MSDTELHVDSTAIRAIIRSRRPNNPLPFPRHDDLRNLPSLRRIIPSQHGDWTLHLYRHRWYGAGGDPDVGVQTRAIDAHLFHGEEPAGRLIFHHFRLMGPMTDSYFYQIMDTDSQAAHDLSLIYLNAWKIMDLCKRGQTLLEFAEMWLEPGHARGSRWVEFLELIIKRSKAGVVLFIPAPLEHIGYDGKLRGEVYDRRRSALRRLYTMRLGAKPIPGDEDWMYRCAADFPAAKKRRFTPPRLW